MNLGGEGPKSRTDFQRDRSGQSELVGVVLVIGLALTVSVIIVALGGMALEESKQTAELRSAEQAMAHLDSKASLAALGSRTEQQTVSLGLRDRGSVDVSDSGRITVYNESLGYPCGSCTQTSLYSGQMGSIEYEGSNGDRVAYQGGGVWRMTESGSVMVSPPEIHFEGQTLTMPLVTIDAANSGHGSDRMRLVRTGGSSVFPSATNGQNPIENRQVRLVIESDYYRGWASYFRTRVDASQVTTDPVNEEVVVVLRPVQHNPPIQGGLITGGNGETDMQGGAGAMINGYNSDNGDYSSTSGSDGNVFSSGDILTNGAGEIRGNLYLDYGHTIDNPADVTGTISHRDIDTSPVAITVAQKLSAVQGSNDNGDISGCTDGNPCSPAALTSDGELGPGEYYVDGDVTVTSELEFENGGGDITLVVDGDVTVENGAELDVESDADSAGTVRLFMAGSNRMLDVDNNAFIGAPNEDSTKFWVYGDETLQAHIKKADFVGVIYAPRNSLACGTGCHDVILYSNTHVYGAIVAGNAELQGNAELHYDEALATLEPVPDGSVARIAYLHVTVNELKAEDA